VTTADAMAYALACLEEALRVRLCPVPECLELAGTCEHEEEETR
jgi:hypothetical protein